jgi:hypothetical protein
MEICPNDECVCCCQGTLGRIVKEAASQKRVEIKSNEGITNWIAECLVVANLVLSCIAYFTAGGTVSEKLSLGRSGDHGQIDRRG